MSFYRVLLVDDDAFFLRVHGDFLSSRGFAVETAQSGEAALELYQAGKYQLVVVDLVMPGISGLELIERLRSLNPAQDIIIITGTDDVRTAVRAMRLGVYDYLTKPIEAEELILVIDRLQERATLYDEHARLLHENIQYVEAHQIVQRALRVMQSLDLETVCERLLETLCEVCAAQGAALWLATEDGGVELSMHGYRGLLDQSALPMTLAVQGSELNSDLARGWPVLIERDLRNFAISSEPAPAIMCPLTREGRVLGAVVLVEKLGGGFTRKDINHARIIGECGSTAVIHARRFRHLERVGLRDPSTSAYNMTYFVDYLGRELHKARRYRRSFSLVQISVDNLAAIKQQLGPDVYREALRRLVLSISSVLRDIDVLARVSDEEMYLLLPEVDFLGGLTVARAARAAVRATPFLAEIDREHPIVLSFGPAAFPRDGDDVDQLFAACRRRLDEARRSLFRRLHLEDIDFWGAVDLLVGEPSAYEGASVNLPRSLAVTEDARGLSRHAIFQEGTHQGLRQEVFLEAAAQCRSSGWLFMGGRWPTEQDAERDSLLAEANALAQGNLRMYALGGKDVDLFKDLVHVTTVHVEDDAFFKHEVVLLLAEHGAYGLLARFRADGRMYGFHTADWTLVEGLIHKLQDAYHLQQGAAS